MRRGMTARLVSLLFLGCLAAFLLSAQQGGQTTPGAGGATTTPTTPAPTPSPGRPTTPTGRTQPGIGEQQTPNNFPEMQRPIFLSGKVVLQDGTAPPEPVVIERVCNGVVRPQGYTDSKGRFSFQLGQNDNMMMDASVGGDPGFGGAGAQNAGMGGFGTRAGVSERELWGCEIRAALAGYRSESVSLTGRRSLDNPEIGTIVLSRFGNVEEVGS